jgi:hypothetical protein
MPLVPVADLCAAGAQEYHSLSAYDASVAESFYGARAAGRALLGAPRTAVQR